MTRLWAVVSSTYGAPQHDTVRTRRWALIGKKRSLTHVGWVHLHLDRRGLVLAQRYEAMGDNVPQWDLSEVIWRPLSALPLASVVIVQRRRPTRILHSYVRRPPWHVQSAFFSNEKNSQIMIAASSGVIRLVSMESPESGSCGYSNAPA